MSIVQGIGTYPVECGNESLSRYYRTARFAGGIAVIVCAAVFFGGWLLKFEFLRALVPGFATMKANTALGLASEGLALYLLGDPDKHRFRSAGKAFALIGTLIGLASIVEYGFKLNFGIDELLAVDANTNARSLPPGRPSPATALAIFTLGSALYLRDWRPSEYLAFFSALVGYVGVLGYLYDAHLLYAIDPYASMALHTALIVSLLAAGTLCARPDKGCMAIVVGSGAGGHATRRLIPAILVVPPILSWLRITVYHANYVSLEFGLALVAVADVVILSSIVFWTARSMELLDHERINTLRALRNANTNLETQVRERTGGLEAEIAKRQASEQTLRALLDSAPDAMVVCDQHGRILMTNNQTETVFGFRGADLLGQPVEMLIPNRCSKNHAQHRTGFMADPKTRSMGVGLELYGLHKDGHEIPVAVSLSPVNLDEGPVVFSAIRNISEQRQFEIKIRELNASLKKQNTELGVVNRELEAFSYSVSHDLRAPLRAIDGFSQALLEDYQNSLDHAGQDYLKRVRMAAQHMGRLIDDLLRLSRVSRGTLGHESVNLSRIGEQIIQDLRDQDPERHVEVSIEPSLVVNGDPQLLEVAIRNLLSNAWKFTAGKPDAEIGFEREQHGNENVFRIRDNGVGFDMTFVDKLFGAFQRLHDSRDYPGTGIGLATVRRVIHRHGGRIWAEAIEGQGATFFFTVGH